MPYLMHRAQMHHHAKFHKNRSNSCKGMAIFPFFFKMVAVRHIGFVGCILGPTTNSIIIIGGFYYLPKLVGIH